MTRATTFAKAADSTAVSGVVAHICMSSAETPMLTTFISRLAAITLPTRA